MSFLSTVAFVICRSSTIRLSLVSCLGLVFLTMPVFSYAVVSADDYQKLIQRLESKPEAALQDLKRIREQFYPGKGVSKASCRQQPEIPLLISAENHLVDRNFAATKNYLAQLRCLVIANDVNRHPEDRLQIIRSLGSPAPRQLAVCPNLAGRAQLQSVKQALETGNVDAGWTALLRASCLMGVNNSAVNKAHEKLLSHPSLNPPAPAAVVMTPEPMMAPVAEPQMLPIVREPLAEKKQSVTAKLSAPSTTVKPKPARAKPAETQPARESSTDYYRRIIEEQTQPGEVAFNPPSQMQLDKTEQIEVRIQRAYVDTTGMQGSGTIQTEAHDVAEVMTVSLCCGPAAEDHAFDISMHGEKEKLINDEGFTQWLFSVTPKKQGTHSLTLSIAGRYRLPSGEFLSKSYGATTRDIQVEVLTKKGSMAWIAVAAFLGLGMVGVLLWRKRQPDNAHIFISYRRADASGWAQMVHDRLRERFGADAVFMDVHDLHGGDDFVDSLNKKLKHTRAVVVVIGKRWLDIRNSDGSRRLDNPEDWVRIEVEQALKSGKKVVPVLVDGATMPPAQLLPESLRPIRRKQAVQLLNEMVTESLDRLIRGLDGEQ